MEGGEERKKRFAERSLRTALPHEGASGPAVDTCCLCGNERCRPCRSKGTRHAQNHQHNSATERKNSLCCRILLKLSLTAGGAPRQRRMEADRMAAPQGPCPLSGGARLTGIESRDDDPPPHGNAAWRGARSGRKGSRNGAGRSAASRRRKRAGRGHMLPLPVWNTGGLCGNECCRKRRAEPLPYLPTTSAAPKISRLRRGKAATRSRFSGLSVRPGSLLKPEPRRPEGTPAYSSSMFLTYMPPSSSASSAAFLSWASRCSRAFCRRARCMASR